MAQLYVYNPSHDEALAAGIAQYFPTKAARRHAADGAMIPMLWAKDGDGILAMTEDYRIDQAQVVLKPTGETLAGAALRHWMSGITGVEPWGWDAHIVHLLTRLGVPRDVMPDDSLLSRIRLLSSRETSVRLLALIRQSDKGDELVGDSTFCRTAAEAQTAISRYGGDAVLKMPWSCSGRGVSYTRNTPADRLAAILDKGEASGGLAVEPYYDLVQNFGAEYVYNKGVPRLLGLSCFSIHGAGQYGCNIVQSQDQTTQTLSAMLAEPSHLDVALHYVLEVLPLILGMDYNGPLGIDMAITADGRLHPCIELNLRRTMGHVALCRAQDIAP